MYRERKNCCCSSEIMFVNKILKYYQPPFPGSLFYLWHLLSIFKVCISCSHIIWSEWNISFEIGNQNIIWRFINSGRITRDLVLCVSVLLSAGWSHCVCWVDFSVYRRFFMCLKFWTGSVDVAAKFGTCDKQSPGRGQSLNLNMWLKLEAVVSQA